MSIKKSNIKWRNITIFGVVMVGLIALAQYFVLPNMEGWTIDRVITYEMSNDIKIDVDHVFTDNYDYGVVMSQETCESSENCAIRLTVSKGRDVSMKSLAEIREYLDVLVDAGVITENQIYVLEAEHSDEVNQGYVISYVPNPREQRIEIMPSLGPKITIREAKVVAAGDVLLHDTVYKAFEKTDGTFDFSPMFADISSFIKPASFAFVNQETNIGGVALGLSSYPNFNSPYEIARDLIDIGFNMFSRANNHTLDKGAAGVLAAEEHWSQFENIVTSGSAASQEQRDQIPILERNGISVALLAYSYGFNGHVLPQGQEYLANQFSYEQAKLDIGKAHELADVVMVSMHWGTEYESLPNQLQQEQAQFLADQGVHVILGSHPHVLQPIDTVTGKSGNVTLVAYSLGNFVSGQVGLDRVVGGILSFKIQKITLREEARIEITDVKLMPTYHFFDASEKIYRIVPLATSSESDYFETVEALMETYSGVVDVVDVLPTS